MEQTKSYHELRDNNFSSNRNTRSSVLHVRSRQDKGSLLTDKQVCKIKANRLVMINIDDENSKESNWNID